MLHATERTANCSVNFSTAAQPALNLEALGRTRDVQSYGDACVARRRRRDRVRTKFANSPLSLLGLVRPLQWSRLRVQAKEPPFIRRIKFRARPF